MGKRKERKCARCEKLKKKENGYTLLAFTDSWEVITRRRDVPGTKLRCHGPSVP